MSHWHRLNPRRLRTIIYATSVAHSIHIADELVRSDVKAEHIDGTTPKEERDEILKRLASGEIEVVVNCQVLTEGFDLPDVGCIVLARPTKSMGLRPAEGKPHCLVLDHAGATYGHGFVEDPMLMRIDAQKIRRTRLGDRQRKVGCSNARNAPQSGRQASHVPTVASCRRERENISASSTAILLTSTATASSISRNTRQTISASFTRVSAPSSPR